MINIEPKLKFISMKKSNRFTKLQNQAFWNHIDAYSEDYSGDDNVVSLEDKFLANALRSVGHGSLLDVGCGRGQRSLMFSKIIKGDVLGIDYSEKMITHAKKLESAKLKFQRVDIHTFKTNKKFDIITSCRCLVNQPTDEDQLQVVKKFESLLKPNGHLIIIERTKQGLDTLNDLRKKFGLRSIPERFHNHYINESLFMPKILKKFRLIDTSRLGVFYFISRVVYPAMIYPREPKQEHIMNKIAIRSQNSVGTKLDYCGLQLMIHLQKKVTILKKENNR